eukprot:13237156-Alexandrium_andersonii.AAC.1
MDFNGAAGFCHCLHLASQLVVGCASWHAPVCSTWINLNMGTSGRRPMCPLGNSHHPSVSSANLMVSRLVLLILVVATKGTW